MIVILLVVVVVYYMVRGSRAARRGAAATERLAEVYAPRSPSLVAQFAELAVLIGILWVVFNYMQ